MMIWFEILKGGVVCDKVALAEKQGLTTQRPEKSLTISYYIFCATLLPALGAQFPPWLEFIGM
jgi:hypothetical protein